MFDCKNEEITVKFPTESIHPLNWGYYRDLIYILNQLNEDMFITVRANKERERITPLRSLTHINPYNHAAMFEPKNYEGLEPGYYQIPGTGSCGDVYWNGKTVENVCYTLNPEYVNRK